MTDRATNKICQSMERFLDWSELSFPSHLTQQNVGYFKDILPSYKLSKLTEGVKSWCNKSRLAPEDWNTSQHKHTHTRLTALFPGLPRWAGTRKVTPIRILLKRDSEWQWHQVGHMQVCTLFQTDNHTSTPPLCFLHAGCPSCRPTNSVKALKATSTEGITTQNKHKLEKLITSQSENASTCPQVCTDGWTTGKHNATSTHAQDGQKRKH